MNFTISPNTNNIMFNLPQQIQETPASLNMNVTESVIPNSVGLSLGSLINKTDKTTEVNIEGKIEPTINIEYSKLMAKPVKTDIPKKFAIQLVSEENTRSMLPKPVTTEDPHINKQASLSSTVGRKLNNWFTRIIDQKGEDYISSGKLTVDEVSRNAERILDDMIAGKVDYSKQGSYIIEPIIIETLVNYCYNKLSINKAIQFSLGYVYNDYSGKTEINDPNRAMMLANIDDNLSRNITQSIAIVNQDIGIYEILYSRLSYVMNTKNVSSLFNLTNELNTYRKMKMKRY